MSDDLAGRVIDALTSHNRMIRWMALFIILGGGCFWYYSDSHNDVRYLKREEIPIEQMHKDHDLLTAVRKDVDWLCRRAGKDTND